jgi:hypothetical protein
LPVNEQEIGYWDIPERILLTKYISGKYWLMQSNKNRTYYVARGINLFDDTNTFLQLRPTNILKMIPFHHLPITLVLSRRVIQHQSSLSSNHLDADGIERQKKLQDS